MHIDVDNNGSVNLAEIYEGNQAQSFKFAKPCEASVQDILSEEFQNQEILDSTTFPLLNKTLKHSLTYLYLRLTVEKKLREKYPVETQNCKQLGEIINKAFKDKDSETICNRVFLTSRKTLLNEFNHFEGNLSIFQPAIDISDQALMKEKKEIEDFVARP